MKSLILCLNLIWVLGCATDERTPIRQAFDEGMVSEIVLAKAEQGICGSGCDPNDPQAYAECIANECGGDGPGNGGGGSGGGGGGGDPYATQTMCGNWSYSVSGWRTRTCCEVVVSSGVQLQCWQESLSCAPSCGQEPPGGTPPPL